MKTTVSILAPVLLASLLAIGGCHHQAAAAKVSGHGIAVSQARLVLPVVKGNPGAAYFTLGNDKAESVTLVRVAIVGAKQAEMHETSGGTMQPLPQVQIDPGQQVVFAPGGKHVMVFNLTPALTPGGSSEITFRFRDGKTVSAPLRIEGGATAAASGDAGGNMAGMPGMDTGKKH